MEQIHDISNRRRTQEKLKIITKIKNCVQLDNYFAPKELEDTLENLFIITITKAIMNH